MSDHLLTGVYNHKLIVGNTHYWIEPNQDYIIYYHDGKHIYSVSIFGFLDMIDTEHFVNLVYLRCWYDRLS